MADSPDPRHFASIKGTAKTVEELGGKWAGASNYGTTIVDRMVEVQSIKTKEVEELKEDSKVKRYPYAIAYIADGDKDNATMLLSHMPKNTILIKTDDATDLDAQTIIQVGGKEIKGANLTLAGENRKLTLDKVNKFIQEKL